VEALLKMHGIGYEGNAAEEGDGTDLLSLARTGELESCCGKFPRLVAVGHLMTFAKSSYAGLKPGIP
jgi:hypothetical protein